MLPDPHSEKVIIGALIFVIALVVSAQLYGAHIRRAGEAELMLTNQSVLRLETDAAAWIPQDTGILIGVRVLGHTDFFLLTDDAGDTASFIEGANAKKHIEAVRISPSVSGFQLENLPNFSEPTQDRR